MPSAFRTDPRFHARIEKHLARLARALDLTQPRHRAAATLRRVEPESQRAGSKPLVCMAAETGERYVFKQCEPALAAAEEVAYELRRLGRRPAVPAKAETLELDGSERTGVLKPYVSFQASEELTADTTTWTAEQRAVMLLEHAWEWFLDNLDTNTSQYALLGPLALPVNIDWDRSFSSGGRSEFSRFAKYRSTLPNARTFLYADYVAGRTNLPLWLLSKEARRIRGLPRAEVTAAVERYARVRFSEADERQQFTARMLLRQRVIEYEVAAFMRSLWAERRALEAPPRTASEWLHRKYSTLWAEWQLVLNAVLRGPVGMIFRRVLSRVRGLQATYAPPRPREPEESTALVVESPGSAPRAGA